jgi:hypothetical protein
MRPALPSLALVVAAACGGNSAAPDADEGLACVNSGRGDDYTVGLERVGKSGLFDVKLMSASPAPPGFNDNTWIIQINAMTDGVVGAPVDGASLLVTPFMPDHQHGTLKVRVEPVPEAGHYRLTPINMWMPGYWETTIDIEAGGARDSVIYKFCIQA